MRGITVQLAIKEIVGYDPFGTPITEETEVIDVHDVLVGQPSTDDVINSVQMYGKKIEYVLGIPKGDTNDWVNATVYINGEKFRTIGYPQNGIPENVPLRWGKNVRVEHYA